MSDVDTQNKQLDECMSRFLARELLKTFDAVLQGKANAAWAGNKATLAKFLDCFGKFCFEARDKVLER